MREFRRASDEFRATIETNLEINHPDPPPALPLDPTPAEEPVTVAGGESGALADSALEPYATSAESAATAPVGEPYVAQRGSPLFHGRDCGWVKRIPEAERVYFKRVAEAREGGLAACPVCEPWEPGG